MKTRLLSALFLVFTVLVFGVSWKIFSYLEKETREAKVSALKTVLYTAREGVHLWSYNIQDKAKLVAINPPLVNIVSRQLKSANSREGLLANPALEDGRKFISDRHKDQKGYYVIDPGHQNIIAMDNLEVGKTNILFQKKPKILNKVFETGNTALVTPVMDKAPIMFALAPVKDQNGNVAAVLALAIDPAEEFSEVARLGRIGNTGETYIFDKDGKMLSNSRFRPQLEAIGLVKQGVSAILKLDVRDPGGDLTEGYTPIIPREKQNLTLMASSAIGAGEGFSLQGYRDYRGAHVLGYWLWDEELNVGMATEIDELEAMTPFYRSRTVFMAILGGAMTLALFLAFFLMWSQAKSANKIMEVNMAYEQAAEDAMKAHAEMTSAITDVRRQEQLLQTIVDNTTAIIYLKDQDGKYILVNRRYAQLIKSGKEAAKGKTDYDFFPKSIADRLAANDRKALMSDSPTELEEEAVFGDKKRIYLSVKFPLRRITGDPYAICNISTDITERKKVEEELQLAASVFENSVEGVIVTDANAVIQSVNPAFSQVTGYSAEEALGKNPNILRSGKHDKKFYSAMWNDLIKKGRWEGEIWNRKKSGEPYLQKSTITAIKDFSGSTTQYAAVFYDITEMRKSEQEVQYKAYHDALTGLPNRQLFHDRLKQTITRAKRSKNIFSVLFIDLDGFKLINDSLGHAVGDMLLKGVAIRLVGCAREEDTVARLGGDEFTIILEDIDEEQEAATVTRRIIQSLSEPFNYKNEELFISSSIGIAIYPQNGHTAEDLLKNADLAMYSVKTMGKNNYKFFTASLNEKAVRRHELENKLRKALEKNEIFALYQPKVDLATGAMTGMEALMRWVLDTGEFISPAEFIPLAEETGLIRNLDEWMLDVSCRFMRSLGQEKLVTATPDSASLSVSINFSAKDLEQVNFVEKLIHATKRHKLHPSQVEVEVTENALIKNIDSAIKKLGDLREYGFNISIDDFGIGYSSLSYLVKFPINYLKLDRSFVVDLFKDPDAQAVAKAVVSMAHEIGVKVVAEGVETREQLAFLKGINCDQIQGYLFSKPVSMEEILKILREKKTFDVS